MTYLIGREMQPSWDKCQSIKQMRNAPVQGFHAWVGTLVAQISFWPDEITLRQEFFETLRSHAAPPNTRSVHTFPHSPSAMDIYS